MENLINIKYIQIVGKYSFYYIDAQMHNIVKEVLLKIKLFEDIKIFL